MGFSFCILFIFSRFCLLVFLFVFFFFFFSSRRRHTRCLRDWSSDVCSSDLGPRRARRSSRRSVRAGLRALRNADRRARLPAETAAETMSAILRDDPPDPSTLNVTVPPGVLRKIGRASCRERV